MKNKIDLKIVLIIVLLLIFIIITYRYFKTETEETTTVQTATSENVTVSETAVETKTILKTISSSGEISSGLSENLALHATYYFSEIYFGENDNVKEGENILKYTNGTYLVAPYDLVITAITIPESGQKCTSKHAITVSNTDNLTMNLQVAEDELDRVLVGQEAQIQVSVYEGTTYTGYVTKISSTAIYSSNGSNFAVTVEFQNDKKIQIGMSGTCSVILAKAEEAIVVPIEAVTTSNNKKYVTVVTEGTTNKVEVQTGISNDAYTQITDGLTGNETVQIVTQTSSQSSNNWSQREQSRGMEDQKGMQMTQMGEPPN